MTRIDGARAPPLVGFQVAVAMTSLRASAQVNSDISNVSISAAVQKSISVSVGLGSVNFTLLAGGMANGGATGPVTANSNLPAVQRFSAMNTLRLWQTVLPEHGICCLQSPDRGTPQGESL